MSQKPCQLLQHGKEETTAFFLRKSQPLAINSCKWCQPPGPVKQGFCRKTLIGEKGQNSWLWEVHTDLRNSDYLFCLPGSQTGDAKPHGLLDMDTGTQNSQLLFPCTISQKPLASKLPLLYYCPVSHGESGFQNWWCPLFLSQGK